MLKNIRSFIHNSVVSKRKREIANAVMNLSKHGKGDYLKQQLVHKNRNDKGEPIPIVHLADQATRMDTQSLDCLVHNVLIVCVH